MKVLAGWRILNTRPQAQAETLSETLSARGAITIELPLIEITPTHQWRKKNIENKNFKYIIFTSPNAVTYFLENIEENTWLARSKIISIGKGTSSTLLKYGLTSCLSPNESNSEGILNIPELEKIRDTSILLIKGIGGRTLLPKTLKSRGARLQILQVYRRTLPATAATTLKTLWQTDSLDIIIITSVTVLRHLFQCLESETMRQWIIKKPFFVISERIAQSLKHQKIETMVVTNYDHLLNTLEEFAHGRHHKIITTS